MGFFTKVGSQMVVSGKLNNRREAGGQMAGKEFMKNVREGEEVKYRVDLHAGLITS